MILVTGATGFIGRSLTPRLTQAGFEWRAYGGRMNAPLALRAELEGVDTVIHLAGSEARGRKRLLQHVDIEGTERLIEEARRAGIGRLILPSRLNADPHAIQPLLRAKGEVERMVQRSTIPYTILRTATLYGRDDRFTEMAVSLAIWSWPFAWQPGGGKATTQPLWVEDFARCLAETVRRPDLVNRVVVLAGDERMTYRQVLDECLDARDLRRIRLPWPMALMRPTAALLTGWWYWPAVSRFMIDRFFVPEVTDLDSVQRAFGFAPARFHATITYLNRPGLAWRLFRH
jgi:NADH dehydrogenase